MLPPRRVVPTLVFVCCLAVGIVALTGGALAETPGADSTDATAERSLNTTGPEPGETVTVTLTVDLQSASSIDYVDDFDPAFAGGTFVNATENGSQIFPLFQDISRDLALVTFDNGTGPGTVETTYRVTVPSDADPGTVYRFNGTLRVNRTTVQIDGPAELAVGGVFPPTFDVGINETGTDSSVTAGNELTVAATVENTGNRAGSQSVRFDVDGTRESTESVSLGPGETRSLNFTYETGQDDIPVVNATVASDNDTATTAVDVVEDPDPAEYLLSGLTPESATVTDDEQVDVTVTVTNQGDETGTQDIVLGVTDSETGTVEYSDTVAAVTLDPGEETTVQFEAVPVGGLDPGEYTHEVSSANDTVSGDLTVEAPPERANYRLSGLTPESATVTGDEQVDVTVTVTNEGNGTGTQDITLGITDNENGAVGYSDTVTAVVLDPGNEQTVLFEAVPVADLGPGEYTHEVSSTNDTVTGTLTVEEPPEGANYRLSGLVPESATVTTGADPLNVTVTVTNEGNGTGTQDVELVVSNGTAVQYDSTVESLAVPPGEEEAVTFEAVPIGGLDPGTYTHEVSSANDTVTGTLEVGESPEPALFAVDNLTPPDSVVVGESFSVTATVENTGDADGTQTITLEAGGETETQTLMLGANERTTVTFEAVSVSSAGDREVRLYSENDTATGTVAVASGAAYFAVTLTTSPEVPAGETVAVDYTVENTGDIRGTQDIAFLVGGAEEGVESGVELGSGETFQGTFEYAIETTDVPELELAVASANETATGATTVLAPASLAVTIDTAETDERVVSGESFTVTADVENTGDVSATREISVTVDGDRVDTREVTLDGGGTTSVAFSIEPGSDTAGSEVAVTVSSGDDTDTTAVTVLADAQFRVSLAALPDNVTAGESITVTADVENTGDVEATGELSLTVDGTTVSTETLTLAGGGSDTVSFSYQPTETDTELGIGVTSPDDMETQTLTVVNGTDSGDDANGDGFGLVAAILAVGLGVLVLARRSRS